MIRLPHKWSWAALRRIDLLWLTVVVALAALATTRHRHSPFELLAVAAIAAVQIAEMRFDLFTVRWGALATIVVKLGLAWVLVWVTEGIQSSYYLIFLLPVVTAASNLGMLATILTAAGGSAAYCSFLALVWDRYELTPSGASELAIRVLFLFMTGILLNHFVTESRRQAERYRVLADDLASASRELGQAQAQVRRSERLAALGQLSAGLAHELRNKLGVIRGSAEVVSKNVPPENSIAREMASLTVDEVDRTNALVNRFLEFARPSPLRRSTQDVHAVLERALAQVRPPLAPELDNLRLERDFAPDLPPFAFDAEMMERVFFNLLRNAVEAMPGGGTLRVSTRRGNGVAEAEIADTGEGIAPENLESIFNPFFTTKPDGVGLGLAIVSKIVDEHGGKITVTSRPGEGATFHISLPLEVKA
ncbi:MAG: hypothetical protein HY236_05490 [Acidobacteria bacterium]|nr:hypothetical protein [Acidobacteriota bacterium]